MESQPDSPYLSISSFGESTWSWGLELTCQPVHFLHFSTEAWTIILISLTQDLPSLILRLIILVNCGFAVQSTLYFFTIKNFLLLVIQILRVRVLFLEFKELNAQALKMISPGISLASIKSNQIEPLCQSEGKSANESPKQVKESDVDSKSFEK